MAPPKRVGKIRNKLVRSQKYNEELRKRTKDKVSMRRERRKEERKDPSKIEKRLAENIPRTIESAREWDPAMDKVDKDDEQIQAEQEDDEFADYFAPDGREPKILVTTSKNCNKITYDFVDELLDCFPNSEFVRRKGEYSIQDIGGFCTNRGFTDLMVVNEDRKQINAVSLIHLPNGPTYYFTLSSLQLTAEISGHGRSTRHSPELILNNFSTRLGLSLSRHLQTLFPKQPHFEGRQVVTVHCQRDYLFFRRHRYMFAEKKIYGKEELGTRLQELGPRFTLKLRWAQKGIYDPKQGTYTYVHKPGEESKNRRKFYL